MNSAAIKSVQTESSFNTWHRKYTYMYNLMPDSHKDTLINTYNKIPGYINATQTIILHLISILSDFAVLVEVGSFKGKSTIIFANSNPDLKVLAIDSFDGGNDMKNIYEDKDIKSIFLRNIEFAKVENVSLFAGPSKIAAQTVPDNSVDYVFLDGSHLYDDIKNDIIDWTPKVRIGGLLFGHDYGLTDEAEPVGVRKAVHELVKDNPNFIRFGEICGMWGAIRLK